jgi:hypothetical protein
MRSTEAASALTQKQLPDYHTKYVIVFRLLLGGPRPPLNVLAKVRVADQPAVKTDPRAVINAKIPPRAASPTVRKPSILGPSPACATILIIC